MRRPYTLHYEEAVFVAGTSVAATLSALLGARPLRTPFATGCFLAALWLAALGPHVGTLTSALHVGTGPLVLVCLQLSATLTTLAMFAHGPRWLGAAAAAGQLGLLVLGLYCLESNFELSCAHLFLSGLLLGADALRSRWGREGALAPPRSYAWHDAALFAVTVVGAALVASHVFGRMTPNGDEIANSFQADVFAHGRAYAPVPPCAAMFENYWVFRHAERVFAQYTPGWPLFMAPFQRFGVIWLAGPVMAGVLAVGVAHLSRRLANGLGRTPEESGRIVAVAGVLGAALAMLGASMLMNGASRFPHTMVCACLAWGLEGLCVIAAGGAASRRADIAYGALFGATAALIVGTRPADGMLLGTGIALYLVGAIRKRRISSTALLSAAVACALLGGLALVILRLQLGTWFKTGYAIAALYRPEAVLSFAFPGPKHLKHAIPLATGSYCWWPAAPAIGVVGLLMGLGGRERRLSVMLLVSGFTLHTFYFFVKFGRLGDNGLGPRYLLPLVVPMAVGGAAALAPLLASWREPSPTSTPLGAATRALLVVLAAGVGTLVIAPLVYPVAREEYARGTAPLRAAARLGLKHAIVVLEDGRVNGVPANLAQNEPMAEDPATLFLIRRNDADEACARAHFPGRDWYRAGKDETLTPYPGGVR
jgi:hypothetical protein